MSEEVPKKHKNWLSRKGFFSYSPNARVMEKICLRLFQTNIHFWVEIKYEKFPPKGKTSEKVMKKREKKCRMEIGFQLSQ